MRRPWMAHRLTNRDRRAAPSEGPDTVGSPILLFAAVIAVMAVIAFVTFLVAVKGRERTLVPDVRGLDLLEALPELQERGLRYVVAPVFSSEVPRNGVISQAPAAGAVVKQGREVELSVSRGAVLDQVPDYVGWTLRAVRENIGATFSSSYSPLLRIAEPPSYLHAEKPEGTILRQEPAKGTSISGVTDLHFVVSLGPEGQTLTIGDYVGLSYADALADLAEGSLRFVFTLDTTHGGDPGEVLSQSPKAGSQVPSDAMVQLWMRPPAIDRDTEVFDVFQYEVQEYAVRVPLRVELDSREAPAVLFSMAMHPGGLLTVPYVARKNDEVVLLVDEREIARVPADPTKR